MSICGLSWLLLLENGCRETRGPLVDVVKAEIVLVSHHGRGGDAAVRLRRLSDLDHFYRGGRRGRRRRGWRPLWAVMGPLECGRRARGLETGVSVVVAGVVGFAGTDASSGWENGAGEDRSGRTGRV